MRPLDQITHLRAEAALQEAGAELNRAWATELHGNGRHVAAFALEHRAEAQELRASQMRERARAIAACTSLDAGIIAIASGLRTDALSGRGA